MLFCLILVIYLWPYLAKGALAWFNPEELLSETRQDPDTLPRTDWYERNKLSREAYQKTKDHSYSDEELVKHYRGWFVVVVAASLYILLQGLLCFR